MLKLINPDNSFNKRVEYYEILHEEKKYKKWFLIGLIIFIVTLAILASVL